MKIPVGYSAADVRDVLWDTYNYVACTIEDEEDDLSRADFFALNSYSWCGKDATFESSSFDDLVEGFKDAPVPIFFSEYGCNETPQRFWTETQSIYGEDMYHVFSGGVVYEYTMEKNDYGLVQLAKNPEDEAEILGDYVRLRSELSKIDWEKVQSMKPENNNNEPEVCKPSLIKEKGFLNNFTLPELPPGAPKIIKNGVKPKPSGKLVDIDSWDVTLPVVDTNGERLQNLAVKPLEDSETNWNGKNDAETGDDKDNSGDSDSQDDTDSAESNQDDEDAAVMAHPLMWAAAAPLVAMLFA